MYHCMYVLQTFIYYKSLNENYFHFFILFFFFELMYKDTFPLVCFYKIIEWSCVGKDKQTN